MYLISACFTVISILDTLNGIYRLFYFKLYLKVDIVDIPVEITTLSGKKVFSTEPVLKEIELVEHDDEIQESWVAECEIVEEDTEPDVDSVLLDKSFVKETKLKFRQLEKLEKSNANLEKKLEKSNENLEKSNAILEKNDAILEKKLQQLQTTMEEGFRIRPI